MPQFSTTGRHDVSGAQSMAGGKTAEMNAKRSAGEKNPGAPKAKAKEKAVPAAPGSLNYFMKKANGRKNAAYTMWKRYKQDQRRGGNS